MTNIEIKNEILRATKGNTGYSIRLTIWHGDGGRHEDAQGIAFDVIYADIDIRSRFNDIIEHNATLPSWVIEEIKDTPENMKMLKAEQKKAYDYLKKHFDKVTIHDENL